MSAPPYTDAQLAFFRNVMGYTKLFASSNAIFEDILINIPNLDDGSTYDLTITLMTNIQQIDQLILNNEILGLATSTSGQGGVNFDAYRNDRMLRGVGRNYIKKLSIIFTMQPAQDYYGRPSYGTSGNVQPIPWDT
jgi:hypothetical protein